MKLTNNPIIFIVGPTACGKTHLAVHLAADIDAEIISADSRQVYRGMDIGTGKDLSEYQVDGKSIRYHLIDIVDAGYQYNVFEFQRDFFAACQQISNKGKQILCCGGTGMYIESVIKQYRLEQVPKNELLRQQWASQSDATLIAALQQKKILHNVSDTSDRNRLIRALEIADYYASHPQESQDNKLNYKIFNIDIPREEMRKRIGIRLDERLQNGMVEEVQTLLRQGISADTLKYYGLEYKFIAQYLLKEIDYQTMHDRLQIAIGQFAKRQQTWFRKMQREGIPLIDIPYNMPLEEKITFIKSNI